MYSVEEEEKQKSEEKPDEDPAVTSTDDNEDKTCRDALTRTQKADSADTEKVAEREDDIETTEYDISTDDDSLRMIYSSTDQVTPQNVNQEIKKIRFFVAGLITDWFILLHSSLLLSQLCHNHIAQHEIRMINKHNKALDFLVKSTVRTVQSHSLFPVQSNCCSEICSRRSSTGSYPALHCVGQCHARAQAPGDLTYTFYCNAVQNFSSI